MRVGVPLLAPKLGLDVLVGGADSRHTHEVMVHETVLQIMNILVLLHFFHLIAPLPVQWLTHTPSSFSIFGKPSIQESTR